jgi:hypothetical protein
MISEKDFASQVEDLFDIYHWVWAHFRPARTSKGWRTAMSGTKGFPDYVAARIYNGQRQILFIELKAEEGTLTFEQGKWANLLGGYIWKPSMLEQIVKILKDGK